MPRRQHPPHLTDHYITAASLRAQGAGKQQIAEAVDSGRLRRIRRGRYVGADVHDDLVKAGCLGARLDCVSLLRMLGVFVRTEDRLHVQVERGTSRIPDPSRDVVRHWRVSTCRRTALAADLIDALAQAVRCQSPRDAIATLDNAWHLGLVDESAIADVFARLPLRYRPLRALVDPRAESGPETLMRLLLRGLGCDVELQMKIPGVGRVDLVVDGWLILECDSRGFHDGWEAHKRDRRRDLAAAALGYTTVRPLAEDILYQPAALLATMKAIVAHHTP